MKVFGALFLVLMLRSCAPLYPRTEAAATFAPPKAAATVSIPILTYHRFGPAPTELTTITTKTFEYQLDYLGKHGYTVISTRMLVDWLRGSGPPPPPRSVVIAADDGHKSVYTDMLPIVERYKAPVTLFIYPSAISNAPYALTWDQLKELQGTGFFDVQSHTYWHPNFNQEKKRLSPAQYEQLVVSQLTKSRQELERRLNIHVNLLAWPYGIFDDFLISKAVQAGYVAAFALGSKPVSRSDPIMALPRYLITEGDKGARFQAILDGAGSEPKTSELPDPTYSGAVFDAITAQPVDGATITLGDNVASTDVNGVFRISGYQNDLQIRAPGYLRFNAGRPSASQPIRIRLEPFRPKALYLSIFGAGSAALREPALKLIAETELNALVIDVKGDRGWIAFRMPIPLAESIGANKEITIRDIHALMDNLKRRSIYTIARIVVFKDEPLATARPDLAVRTPGGAIWRDRESLAWTDPFDKEVWSYNIDIAVEAAKAGFDEIQFDYVRFPDARGGLVFSEKATEQTRLKAISGFLREARRRLMPYNVFLSSDIFGYVCWNPDDTGIGQRLEELGPSLDYISPMLYPSGFQFGIPGIPNPVQHPYEIVYQSLEKAKERTHLAGVHFRPWLQAFRDYAFDRRNFGGLEIGIQIEAAERFGSDGWMLWNPHNVYSAAGLRLGSAAAPEGK